jgi:predicted transcriptional regulator of viral defense system
LFLVVVLFRPDHSASQQIGVAFEAASPFDTPRPIAELVVNADPGVHEALLNLQFQPLSRAIFKKIRISQLLAYNMGMTSLDQYLDAQLVRGRAHFTSEEALVELRLSSLALKAAIGRMTKKQRVANLRHGFYLILRPEDRVAGAPDPARWIDPLMKYQGIDYRVSLLRAAAFHGSSHQAAMTFQVIVPKQLRDFEIGRHRLQFVYQAPAAFAQVNQSEWLGSMKSEAGFAKVAGVELTLLDCARYFHKSAGINGLAQIVKDIGTQADTRKLAKAAEVYENASVRRLGYLLDQAGCEPQANALEPFVKRVKTSLPLDPSVKPLIASLAEEAPRIAKWKLIINEPVEADF